MFDEVALPAMGWNFDALVPAADVEETDEAVTVRMDLPGHDPKNIHVDVENDVLTVRSERRSETTEKDGRVHRRERSYGLYARSFVLPAIVDASKAEARYENGVLTVTLPKHAEARPKRIAVKVRS
jgi:HSP20 family protein